MIKIRIPTHYYYFKEDDLKMYYDRCYYGEPKQFEIVTNNDYDYLLLINRTINNNRKPVSKRYAPYYKYDKKRTILFQNEAYKKRLNWDKKSSEFYNPKYKDFFHVFDIKRYHNMVIPVYKFNNINKLDSDVIISILSGKKKYLLQKQRVAFYKKYIENSKSFTNIPPVDYSTISKYVNFDHSYISNKTNGFYEYRFNAYLPYKYVFQCECLDECNYFTEKIIEPLMCECLTFYCGCSNLDKFIDKRCYIRLNLSRPEEAYNIIMKSIKNNEWEKRIKYIRREKERIHKEMSFIRMAERLILEKNKGQC